MTYSTHNIMTKTIQKQIENQKIQKIPQKKHKTKNQQKIIKPKKPTKK